METITGKKSRSLCAEDMARLAAEVERVLVDLGTGDGRFVLQEARSDPRLLAIGVDASRENLRQSSRTAPPNVLYAIGNALALPPELDGLAQRITINFPWGSLLTGLLTGDAGLLGGLRAAARPGAVLEVRLNASALAGQGYDLASGGEQVRAVLEEAGLKAIHPVWLDSAALRAVPSTWARKMAFGRRPEAVFLRGYFKEQMMVL